MIYSNADSFARSNGFGQCESLKVRGATKPTPRFLLIVRYLNDL